MRIVYFLNKHEHQTTFNLDNYADVARAKLLMNDLVATRVRFSVDYS